MPTNIAKLSTLSTVHQYKHTSTNVGGNIRMRILSRTSWGTLIPAAPQPHTLLHSNDCHVRQREVPIT